jgi:hypothetical protein
MEQKILSCSGFTPSGFFKIKFPKIVNFTRYFIFELLRNTGESYVFIILYLSSVFFNLHISCN